MSVMAENPKRALLVIDVQNEYFTGKLPITYPAGSLANVLSAMDAAREHEVPVVVIQHASPQPDAPVFREGSKEWELHPEVATRPHDVLIHKTSHGGFGVEFLSDGTGTLAIKNDAGEVSDEELHRAILVTQQMRFSRVMQTGDWIKQL